jgi:hypothetical protein
VEHQQTYLPFEGERLDLPLLTLSGRVMLLMSAEGLDSRCCTCSSAAAAHRLQLVECCGPCDDIMSIGPVALQNLCKKN